MPEVMFTAAVCKLEAPSCRPSLLSRATPFVRANEQTTSTVAVFVLIAVRDIRRGKIVNFETIS